MEKTKSLLKIGALVLLTGAAGFIIWKKFMGGPIGPGQVKEYNFDQGEGGDSDVPQRMKINYVPADFRTGLKTDDVLRIMSEPSMYRRDFNKMVGQLNMEILIHVANRMNLPDEIKSKIEGEYRKHHNYLRDLYYYDVIALRDSTSSTYEQWYQADATKSVDALYEVAGKYTCFLVNHVITTLLESTGGTLSVRGKKVYSPCSVAMEEGLKPLVNRLQEGAIIRDFESSEGVMEQRMEKVIAELATIEVRDKKGLSKELSTKVWGYQVSSTDLEITAISIMKVGFKLDEYFEIETDSRKKQVVVTLPQPKILAHEVYPKIDKLDVGWLREISNDDFNKNFNLLRREFRKDAEQNNVGERAKKEAENLMETILEPMVKSLDPSYKVVVRYRGNNIPSQEDIKWEQNAAQLGG